MKLVLGKSVGLLVWLAFAAGARADMGDAAAGNPYETIPVRNVFSLHAPAEVTRGPDQPTQIQSKVKLTGLSSLSGVKQAYFSIAEPASSGKPAGRQKYCTMTEGQRNEGLQLLAIDLKGQKVKVRLQGEFMELALEKSAPAKGAPASVAPPTPAAISVPPPMNTPVPLGQTQRPQRTEPTPDPEAQTVLIELERMRSEASVAQGSAPPLPVTPMTAEVAGTSTGE